MTRLPVSWRNFSPFYASLLLKREKKKKKKQNNDYSSNNIFVRVDESKIERVKNFSYLVDSSPRFQVSVDVSLSLYLSFPPPNVERYFHRILATWNRKYRFFSLSLSLDPPLRRLNPVARYLKVLFRLMVFSHGHPERYKPLLLFLIFETLRQS